MLAPSAPAKCCDKFLHRYSCLFQDAAECAGLDFAVHGDDAPGFPAFHDDMASALPDLYESRRARVLQHSAPLILGSSGIGKLEAGHDRGILDRLVERFSL